MNKKTLNLVRELMVLPESRNFSEYNDDGSFDRSDDGAEEEELYQEAYVEQVIIQISSSLNDRQKVVFLYQIIKDLGFNFSQENLARTLDIGRASYANILSKVQKRARKVINANKQKK